MDFWQAPNDKRWLVKWANTESSNETWETYELKDVEAFQQYCASLQLQNSYHCPGKQKM